MNPARNFVYIIFTFSFLLNLALVHDFTSAQEVEANSYMVSYCSEYAHYDEGSEFQNNLYLLSSNLTRKANTTNFYNFTTGEAPNRAYGLFFCDGLSTNQSCLECVRKAVGEIQQRCAYSKVYLVWYVGCMLRYADQPMFSVNDVSIYYYLIQPPAIYGEFSQTLSDTFTNLIDNATAVDKLKALASEVVNIVQDLSLACYVDCTPHLSTSDCMSCLQTARRRFQMIGAKEGALLQPSCKMMYAFNDTRSSKTGKKPDVALGVTSAVAGASLLLNVIFLFLSS